MERIRINRRISLRLVDWIKEIEGLSLTARRHADGGYVIGYGHRQSVERPPVSLAEAEILLIQDLSNVADALEQWILAPLNPLQFEALTSFAYDIGLQAFSNSQVLKYLNQGAYFQAASAMEFWRRSPFEGEGKVVDLLIRRRAIERARFLSPPDHFPPSAQVLAPQADDRAAKGAAPIVSVEGQAGAEQAPIVHLDWLYPDGQDGNPSSKTSRPDAPAGSTKFLSPKPWRASPLGVLTGLMGLVGLAIFIWALCALARGANLPTLAAGLIGVVIMTPPLISVLERRLETPATQF